MTEADDYRQIVDNTLASVREKQAAEATEQEAFKPPPPEPDTKPTNPKDAVGLKFDEGKPTFWRALRRFPLAVAGASAAADYGFDKYCRRTGLPDDNWKHVDEAGKRYFDAMIRHWGAIQQGEVWFEEDGRRCNHWHSFAWNALALAQMGLEAND